MARAKTVFVGSIPLVQAEEFSMLTPMGQAVFQQMWADASCVGEVSNPARVLRASGLDESGLDELKDGGYFISVDGTWYLADWWLANSARESDKDKTSWLFEDGYLEWEDKKKPYNSRMVPCEVSPDIPRVTPNCPVLPHSTQRNATQHHKERKNIKKKESGYDVTEDATDYPDESGYPDESSYYDDEDLPFLADEDIEF